MSVSPLRIRASDSALIVVDVQEKLLPLIERTPTLLINIAFLLDAAKLFDVPSLVTEQYPKGLGPTTPVIAERLSRPIPEKTAFSCFGSGQFAAQITESRRSAPIVVGIETHVCVMQTCLDLLDRGLQVVIPVDAVAARGTIDHDTALHRLEKAGAMLVTCEMVAFEWLGGSSSPAFKSISALVQERARRIQEIASRRQAPA